MKINFILPFINITGGVKMVFEYANRLSDRGHDVVIYTPMLSYKYNFKGIVGFAKRLKVSIGNTIIRRNKCNWFNVRVPIKLIPIINEKFIRNSDVIIATAWPTAYDISKMSINKGKKFYFIQGYEIWSGPKESVDGSYKLPIKKIVISNELKYIMNNKFSDNNVDVIFNGIDKNEFYNNQKITRNENILMLYSDLEQKGFEDGINAIELARNEYPNLKLRIFGAKKNYNIPDYAEYYFNPSKDELRKLYSMSDVFVFPSRSEGWGLTPIEAMACKCAVVGTKVGSISEIGIHEYNCMISKPNDILDLSKNLIKLIKDKELRERVSYNGYKTSQELAWENSVNKMETLIIK